jgi:hypothetical protein
MNECINESLRPSVRPSTFPPPSPNSAQSRSSYPRSPRTQARHASTPLILSAPHPPSPSSPSSSHPSASGVEPPYHTITRPLRVVPQLSSDLSPLSVRDSIYLPRESLFVFLGMRRWWWCWMENCWRSVEKWIGVAMYGRVCGLSPGVGKSIGWVCRASVV